MKPGALLVLCGAMLLTADVSIAEETSVLPETDFVQVAIDGALNLRAGPTTESERVGRLPNGTLLRRIGCRVGLVENWCEVETEDGSLEGWAAARFLYPWYGADPAALVSPAIAANRRVNVEAPGSFTGIIDRGEVFDLFFSVPRDSTTRISVVTEVGVGTSIFAGDGTVLEQGEGNNEYSVLIFELSEIIVRIADLTGKSANWRLDVGFD